MKSSRLLLGVLFFSTTFSNADTAEQETNDASTTLDEIVVTAPAPSLPTVTTSDAPSYSYSDGADFLRSTPGVNASRFGGHGLELFVRGQSQNQLNIIADDAYTFGGCPNRMDPPSAYLNINNYE